MFQPKFPIIEGCILGDKCRACSNDGLQCRPKGVVYSASCAEYSKNVCDVDVKSEYTYIGETSRTVRLRIKEHMEALSNLNPKSFQLFHWYDKHQTSEVCPEFEFKVVKKFKDALTRQITEAILILDLGGLNRKCEFRINEICRMEAKPPKALEEKERKIRQLNEEQEEKNILTFIDSLKSIEKNFQKDSTVGGGGMLKLEISLSFDKKYFGIIQGFQR